MIVVLDSSVWISALEFGGTPGLALKQALTADQLAISDYIEHEVVRVLTRKFHREPGVLRVALDEILRWAYRVQIQHGVSGICRDRRGGVQAFAQASEHGTGRIRAAPAGGASSCLLRWRGWIWSGCRGLWGSTAAPPTPNGLRRTGNS